jgi:hypothetical protein
MNSKQEIIEEIQGKINSYQSCLNDNNWANTGSDFHVSIRKYYSEKINIYKKIIRFLKKEN